MDTKRHIVTYVMAFAISVASGTSSSAASLLPDPESPRPDEGYEKAVLQRVRPVLLASKKVGRLYYFVPCKNPDYDFPVPFPEVRVQLPLNDHSGLAGVRDIFRGDRRVTVSEESNGIIRVRIGKVPASILQTKIPSVRLKPLEQYNPMSAVFALTSTKAVQAAMRNLALQEAPTVFSIPGNLPRKPAPHFPAAIKDVTLDQALDIVARTFGVIVVFGECTSPTGPSFIRVYTSYL